VAAHKNATFDQDRQYTLWAYNSASSSRFSEHLMAIVWPLQEAKNKLSEVIDRAAKGGPQVVTRHGKRSLFRQASLTA
jgi:hypothetical protein